MRVVMSSDLTITAKGQVTLRRVILNHLGVKPGNKVGVSLLQDGRIEIVPAAAAHDIRKLRGLLRRPGQRVVSLEEMQEGIETGHDE
jgi:hypothetical protein